MIEKVPKAKNEVLRRGGSGVLAKPIAAQGETSPTPKRRECELA